MVGKFNGIEGMETLLPAPYSCGVMTGMIDFAKKYDIGLRIAARLLAK